MYSRSHSDCNSGIPVESIMASKLINRHPFSRRARKAKIKIGISTSNKDKKHTFFTVLSEYFKLFFSTFLNDLYKFTWKKHWRPLTSKPEFALEVPHDMTKINVEEFATLLDHDIIIVPVTNTKDIHGNSVASAGQHEVIEGSF